MSDKPAQQAARARFTSAYAGRDYPDVVVGHEPSSVDGLDDSSLLVNGHTHIPALDGNHLTVGTFTGGGLFGTRIAQDAEQGTEIRTGTYSFDIATFDTTCSLASLHRFTFKGILQGNPDLQSATVLAGSGIVPAAKNRTCGDGSSTPQLTVLRPQQSTAEAG